MNPVFILHLASRLKGLRLGPNLCLHKCSSVSLNLSNLEVCTCLSARICCHADTCLFEVSAISPTSIRIHMDLLEHLFAQRLCNLHWPDIGVKAFAQVQALKHQCPNLVRPSQITDFLVESCEEILERRSGHGVRGLQVPTSAGAGIEARRTNAKYDEDRPLTSFA